MTGKSEILSRKHSTGHLMAEKISNIERPNDQNEDGRPQAPPEAVMQTSCEKGLGEKRKYLRGTNQ